MTFLRLILTLPLVFAFPILHDKITSIQQANEQAVHLQQQLQNKNVYMPEIFIEWNKIFKKTYKTKKTFNRALSIFNASVYTLIDYNSNPVVKFWLGLNQFSSSSQSELDSLLRMKISTIERTFDSKDYYNIFSFIPKFINWTASGHTTPVKAQGACGSCYANAVLSAVEAILAIKYPYYSPTPFSRQIIVSCENSNTSSNFYSLGCVGGQADGAIGFMSAYTIPIETVYPYTSGVNGANGACNTSMMHLPTSNDNWLQLYSANPGSIVWLPDQALYGFDNVIYVKTKNEIALMIQVAVQPVICYWSVGSLWLGYAGGIYGPNDNCPNQIDHVMLIVGYDSVQKFWIVENSYSIAWGEFGFIRVQMIGDGPGICLMYTNLFAPKSQFTKVPSWLSTTPPSPPNPPPSPSPPHHPVIPLFPLIPLYPPSPKPKPPPKPFSPPPPPRPKPPLPKPRPPSPKPKPPLHVLLLSSYWQNMDLI